MPTPEDIARLVDRLRRKLSKQEIAAIKELILAFRGIQAAIQPHADALALALNLEKQLSITGAKRLPQFKTLLQVASKELTQYSGFVKTKVEMETFKAIQRGASDAKAMTIAAADGSTAVATSFRTLNPRVIQKLSAFLEKDSGLYKAIASYANTNTEKVAQTIIDGVALGKNPKTISRLIMADFGGTLADAVRTMRTAQLWSYREANRLSYIANNDVVKGWIWMSVLDSETCPACWAMHGTWHPLSESLDDHYNGHCYAVPSLVGEDPNLIPSAESDFNNLTDAQQEKILGKARYAQYKSGALGWNDLAVHNDNETYGSMIGVNPLGKD